MRSLFEAARGMGFSLTPAHLKTFQAYYEILLSWNERFNLTAITEYEHAQIRHFLDSLSCLLALGAEQGGRWLPGVPAPGTRVVDVGSGAGFPGLPLKVLYPYLDLTLLEAAAKKTDFLKSSRIKKIVDALSNIQFAGISSCFKLLLAAHATLMVSLFLENFNFFCMAHR